MTPRGPIDPPVLSDTAPEAWWENGARDIFDAAASITRILQELEESNALLMTPFTGFCAFSAATMNIYVLNFPAMNLGRSEDAAELLELNISYLQRFKALWPLGEGWYKTIEHTRNLYHRLVTNTVEFRGKTRSDFIGLEASIHDCSGSTALRGDVVASSALLEELEVNDTHLATVRSQQPRAGAVDEALASSQQSLADELLDDSWHWPLWGGEQSMPFSVAGMSFDFNLE
ncbi:fungal specific transcription factor domain-containing protein [Phlyctema vagabunda]|uniref:Fungal specific transcription factor domain-containing protein n=1 Tax=Phlyctema vagabunda TaxID=108571 RepID=A0ABR4PTY7_9HELO